MIDKTKRDELRAKAKAATPGKWECASKGSRILHIHGPVSVEGVIECDCAADAAHIAANDPQTTLALLDALDAAAKDLDEAKSRNAKVALMLRDEKLKWRKPPSALLGERDAAIAHAEKAEAEVERLREALEAAENDRLDASGVAYDIAKKICDPSFSGAKYVDDLGHIRDVCNAIVETRIKVNEQAEAAQEALEETWRQRCSENARLRTILIDCRGLLDRYQDADHNGVDFVPNEEMRLLAQIDAALEDKE